MIEVVYSKNGSPISDFKVYECVDNMIQSHKACSSLVVKTASELYMMVFCLRIMEGKIAAEDVEFYFEDHKLEFDPHLGICDPDHCGFGVYSAVAERCLLLGYQKLLHDKKMDEVNHE